MRTARVTTFPTRPPVKTGKTKDWVLRLLEDAPRTIDAIASDLELRSHMVIRALRNLADAELICRAGEDWVIQQSGREHLGALDFHCSIGSTTWPFREPIPTWYWRRQDDTAKSALFAEAAWNWMEIHRFLNGENWGRLPSGRRVALPRIIPDYADEFDIQDVMVALGRLKSG